MHRQPGCWLRSSHSFKECVIAHWSSGQDVYKRQPFCVPQRYSTRRSPGSSPANARSHTRRKRRHSRFFPWPRGYSCSAARGGMRLSRRACPYHTSRMGQAAMTGLREWCRAGEKSFALIRQMNAKEYTDSVYHKTGREAARKK